jgi:hypothetical protein
MDIARFLYDLGMVQIRVTLLGKAQRLESLIAMAKTP